MSSNDSTNSHPLLLDEAAAAERLSLSKHCLKSWRGKRDKGIEAPSLPYIRLGKSIRYRVEDLDAFLRDNVRTV
jgi:hypothetical protein